MQERRKVHGAGIHKSEIITVPALSHKRHATFFLQINEDVPSKVLNLSQGYAHARQTLDNALAGFCCPDEFFKEHIGRTIGKEINLQ